MTNLSMFMIVLAFTLSSNLSASAHHALNQPKWTPRDHQPALVASMAPSTGYSKTSARRYKSPMLQNQTTRVAQWIVQPSQFSQPLANYGRTQIANPVARDATVTRRTGDKCRSKRKTSASAFFGIGVLTPQLSKLQLDAADLAVEPFQISSQQGNRFF